MKKVFVLLLLLVLVPLAFSGKQLFRWYQADPLQRREIETTLLLDAHQYLDQTPTIVEWVQAYHGDAASARVINTFIGWGTKHQEQFLSLVYMARNGSSSQSLTERIAKQLSQNGAERIHEFKRAFSGYQSEKLDEIFAYLNQPSSK